MPTGRLICARCASHGGEGFVRGAARGQLRDIESRDSGREWIHRQRTNERDPAQPAVGGLCDGPFRDKLGELATHPRFHFIEGDISINREWIEYHVKKCDVVRAARGDRESGAIRDGSAAGVRARLRGEPRDRAPLRTVSKRLVFPSTSEVYGMSDGVLDEDASTMVYGPIHKQRWIYASSKQLLDRVIYAYGVESKLDYTLIRPFNFIGPNLDNIDEPKEGSSRVFTQFLSNVMHRVPIKLVDGGEQKRSFTYIDDAVDCILRIIENRNECATRQIFNIGHPGNCVSVAELARRIVRIAGEFPQLAERARAVPIVPVTSQQYYGEGYQDIEMRVPAIEAARERLGWRPTTDLDSAIRQTIAYYVARGTECFRSSQPPRRRRETRMLSAGSDGSAAPRDLWLVLAIAWFATIGIRPLLEPDEGRYAEIPREMQASGDWVTPRLNGVKYFEKPALQYWATAAVYSVFGVSEWTARLWSCALAFLCIPLVFGFARWLYDSAAVGAAAAAVLAINPFFAIVGQINLLDSGFCFFLTATIFAYLRRWMLLGPSRSRSLC